MCAVRPSSDGVRMQPHASTALRNIADPQELARLVLGCLPRVGYLLPSGGAGDHHAVPRLVVVRGCHLAGRHVSAVANPLCSMESQALHFPKAPP